MMPDVFVYYIVSNELKNYSPFNDDTNFEKMILSNKRLPELKPKQQRVKMRYMSISEFMEKFGDYTKDQLHEIDDYLADDDVYFNKMEYDTDVLLNGITIESIDNTDILLLPFGTVKIIYVDYKDRTLCFVNYQLDDYELYDSKTIGYIVFRYLKYKKKIKSYGIVLIYYTKDNVLLDHYLKAITTMPSHYLYLKFSKYFLHNNFYYCYGGEHDLTKEIYHEIIKQLGYII